MSKALDPETVSQVKSYMDASRLPGEAICAQCSNYSTWCRSVLAGESPFDGNSRYCFFGRADEHFNKDFRAASEFIKAMHKR